MTLTDNTGFDPITGELTELRDYDIDLIKGDSDRCIEKVMRALNELAEYKPLHFPAGNIARSLAKDASYWHKRMSDDYDKLGQQVLLLMAGMGGEIAIARQNDLEERRTEKEEQIQFFETLQRRASDTFENITGDFLPPTANHIIKSTGKASLWMQLRNIEQTIIHGNEQDMEIPDILLDQARNMRKALGLDPDTPHVFKAEDTSDVIIKT